MTIEEKIVDVEHEIALLPTDAFFYRRDKERQLVKLRKQQRKEIVDEHRRLHKFIQGEC